MLTGMLRASSSFTMSTARSFPALTTTKRSMSVSGEIWEGGSEDLPKLTLYTKYGCTLCDKVVDELRSVKEETGIDFGLDGVDITDNFEVFDRYKYDIPVVHYGDEYWFKVSELRADLRVK